MEWSLLPMRDPKPAARWRHTATVFDTSYILIFGGFQTQDHRLNDVWVFDTIALSWTQPNIKHNQESAVPCQLSYLEWLKF